MAAGFICTQRAGMHVNYLFVWALNEHGCNKRSMLTPHTHSLTVQHASVSRFIPGIHPNIPVTGLIYIIYHCNPAEMKVKNKEP